MSTRSQLRPRLLARGVAALGFTAMLIVLSVTSSSAQGADHRQHGLMMMDPGAAATRSVVMDPQPAIGDLTLVDAHGRSVALREAVSADVPVLVNFIFTTCTTICPVMSAGFARVDDVVNAGRPGVRLVSISIDPEADTPGRLREYAAGLHASAQWMFLTGTPASSEAAQRAFGAFRGTKESHTAVTFLRRAPGAPWEQLNGLASGRLLLDTLHVREAGDTK